MNSGRPDLPGARAAASIEGRRGFDYLPAIS